MKVWIVWEEGHGWEFSREIVGIFSSEAKADACVEALRKKHFTYTFWVDEVAVD